MQANIQAMTRMMLITALTILLLIAGPAGAQQPDPGARGFDYWQPDWMVRELWGPGHMPQSVAVRMLRHQTYIHYGVPKEYEGARSPLKGTPDDINAGRAIFAKRCASCHGKDGTGGGQAGKALAPSPALLSYMITRPVSVDEYLLWVISDGGKQFKTAMPAFKSTLEREEIWQVIAYMRAGFPQTDVKPSGK